MLPSLHRRPEAPGRSTLQPRSRRGRVLPWGRPPRGGDALTQQIHVLEIS